jgi:hypothetical protein
MSWTETAKKIEMELSLPPAGKRVIVQCDGFRCLGYRSKEGKWLSAFDHSELENVIGFSLLSGKAGEL